MTDPARRRHDLVRVEPSIWASVLAARPDVAGLPFVADWARQGWPLVARRPDCRDTPDLVALGLPLPPSVGKQRLSFSLPAQALAPAEAPPLLADIATSAPPPWDATLDALTFLNPQIRVFGALAWQALTGLTYLSDTSDIDLLWPLPPAGGEAELLAAIAAIENKAPMRLDGELVRPDGAAVNWRELAAGTPEVLVKRLEGVSMQPRGAFLETQA